MMGYQFLANVDMCEKDLEHVGRLPLHNHLIKVRAYVWILVHNIGVPEVDNEFSGGTVGVS